MIVSHYKSKSTMPSFPPQRPEVPKYWGTSLNRNETPTLLMPQVGFELKGLKGLVDNVCSSHSVVGHSCTIGVFLHFYDDNRQPLNYIEDIVVKKMDVVFDKASAPSNDHWLTRLARDKAELKLVTVSRTESDTEDPNKLLCTVKAKAHRIFHFDRSPRPEVDIDNSTNYSTPITARSSTPYLQLEDADGYGIDTIKGYTNNIRIVYLSYGLLLHMHLSYRNTDETKLKFIFTGAEINHGEIVRPFFQAERCRDWPSNHGEYDYLDPSVTPTLKVESIRIPERDQQTTPPVERTNPELYINGGGLSDVAIPTVHVLAPCPRYWQAIDTILGDASSQLRTNDPASFVVQQDGIGALSEILTKDDLSSILGDLIY